MPKPRAGRVGLVLARDLRRSARSWTTAFGRAVPVLALLAGFVLMLVSTDQSNIGDVNRLGTNLYRVSVTLMMFAAGIVPTIQVLRGVHSERAAGTLDLIALSGIRPSRLLLGVVGTRVLTSALVLAAVLPLLSLIPSLGGVGVGEAMYAFVLCAGVFVTSVALGMVFGVAGRGLAVSLIAVVGFWVTLAFLLPLRLWYLVDEITRFDAYFSPIAFLVQNDSRSIVEVLASFVPYVAVIVYSVVVSAFRIRRAVADGWDPRGKAWPGPSLGWVPHALALIVCWGGLELGVMGGARLRTPAAEWTLTAVGLVALTSASILYLRALCWLLPRLHLTGWRIRVPVLGRGILWKELLTNGQGGLGRIIAIATGGWLFIAFLLVVQGMDDDLLLLWSFAAILAVVGLSVLLVVTGIIDERARGTLPVLMASTVPPWIVVRGKLLGATLRLMPLLAFAALGTAIDLSALTGDLGGSVYHDFGFVPESAMGSYVLTGVPAVRFLLVGAWCFLCWTVLLSGALGIGAAFRSRAIAGTFAALFPIAVLLGLLMVGLTAAVRSGPPFAGSLRVVLFPFMVIEQTSASHLGAPPEMIVSLAVWASLAAMALGFATWSLRRFGTRKG